MPIRRIPELGSFEHQQNVKDKDLSTPPGAPAEGDRYIVAAGGTGAWAGQDGKIAYYFNAAWLFDTPVEGWRLWIEDENKFYFHNGTVWAEEPSGDMTKAQYDSNNDGVVDAAGTYNPALKAITFNFP